jgi:hypothetical protein
VLPNDLFSTMKAGFAQELGVDPKFDTEAKVLNAGLGIQPRKGLSNVA